MLISILVANYNNSRYLENAISSVYAQTYSNWEIILIDDGSKDEFEEVIKRYSNDARIKVFRNGKNIGCASTKKNCIERSSGEVLAFLDPDDSLAPEALQIMHDAHLERPECSIIHSTHYVCDASMKVIRIAEYPKVLPHNTPFLLIGDGSVHHLATFKKSCYNRTPGLAEKRKIDKAVDMELYYLLEEEGSIFFIDLPLYYYRIHSGSISNWGNENLAKIAHYNIIEQACLRRISKLRKNKSADARHMMKRYRTRYHKVSIFHGFRKKNWIKFGTSLMIFPFVGGMDNLISYFKKLPVEGVSLIKKSFVTDYKIIE